jgi:hypothetical protein
MIRFKSTRITLNPFSIKKIQDKEFLPGYLVLKWEARKEDAGKHGKFDHFWFGPFKIAVVEGKTSFSLENIDGEIHGTPIKGNYLKHFMQ